MQLSIFSTPVFKGEDKQSGMAAISAAAQYLMASCFSDEFEIINVSIADEDKGLLRFIRNGRLKMQPQIYDHLALIAIAGIVGTSIAKHGIAFLQTQRSALPYTEGLLSMQGAEEEYQTFKKSCAPVCRALLLEPKKVQWSVILASFDFLCQAHIWKAVQNIAERLDSVEEKLLPHSEVQTILMNLPASRQVANAMDQFRSLRYPLSKHGVTTILPASGAFSEN